MLIVIDVGNTNITVGAFNEEALSATFRMTTKQPRTSDEYGISLCSLLEHNNIHIKDITDIVIVSVVPNVMHSLTSGMIKYLDKRPMIIEPGTKTGICIATENPRQIGADRIVDAVAAYELYGGPVLIIDYGTATTYDLVDEKGKFISCITAPGIRTSAKSLWQEAAKLPEIAIRKPDGVLARDTITGMQVGVVYGQIGQTEYIVKQTRIESGIENLKVVATGGLGTIIVNETNCIDIYDPALTLQGMRLIYNKQKFRKI